MDNNKLKVLNLLKQQIEKLEEYREKLGEAAELAKEGRQIFTLGINAIDDVKFPYIGLDTTRALIKSSDIDFNDEIKILIILMLEKVDSKLKTLKDEFENG